LVPEAETIWAALPDAQRKLLEKLQFEVK